MPCHHDSVRGFDTLPGVSPKTLHMHFEMRSRRPATADGSEPHDRHCRSARSTGRFPGRQFFRRGDARRRWHRPTGRLRRIRNAPMIAPDCRTVRDRCRPDCACTIRTTRPAARHSENAGRDGRDDENGLPRSTPTHIAPLLQLRWYALLLEILCGRDRFSAIKTAALRGTISGPAARSTARKLHSGSGLQLGFKAFQVAKMRHRVPLSGQRLCAGSGGTSLHRVNVESRSADG
jgi:hypothetical protein